VAKSQILIEPLLDPVITWVSLLLKTSEVNDELFEICGFKIAKGLLSRLLYMRRLLC
jgi:hypothetical protein